MVYRRTHQVVKRLEARRAAILAAARETASEGGMAAVQIAPVAARANVAAGTVYRYFPSKADLISELIADVSDRELIAIRRAEPDEGEVRYEAVFAELEALGWPGWIGCEYKPRTTVEAGLVWLDKLGVTF